MYSLCEPQKQRYLSTQQVVCGVIAATKIGFSLLEVDRVTLRNLYELFAFLLPSNTTAVVVSKNKKLILAYHVWHELKFRPIIR